MAVRIIAGRAGSGKTAACLEAVRQRLLESLVDGPALLLLVPEQAALQTQRALLEAGPFRTLGRCEVLGFRRLTRRILAEAPGAPRVLSQWGRQMLLRRLIQTRRDALRAFGGVADRPGFIVRLAEVVRELIEHAVTPADLRTAARRGEAESDRVSATLADAAELYEAYLEALGSDIVDPQGVVEAARQNVARATWLKGAEVWLDAFAGFTRSQLGLLCAVARCAASVEVALLMDPDSSCLDAAGAPPDITSHFHRTARTCRELMDALAAAGIAVVPPTRLRPVVPPRFRHAELAGLERGLFQVLPREPGDAAGAAPVAALGAVRLVEAANLRDEAAAAAAEVRRLTITAAQPMRFRDVAIICRTLEPYHALLSAALRAHGIPYFIDHRRSTAHHALPRLLRAAMALHDRGRFSDAVLSILKSGLAPLDDAAADELENFVVARGIRSAAAWRGHWTVPKEESAGLPDPRRVERAKVELLGRLGAWAADDPGPPRRSCKHWCAELYRLLSDWKVAERLADWAAEARASGDMTQAEEHQQVWNDTVALLDETADALGAEEMTAGEFADLLDAGLAEFTLGLVPPTLDQVLVGAVDRSRHPPVRAVLLLGFTEGQFPLRPGERPILDDDSRERLQRAGVAIGPTRSLELLDERLLAYVAVTRASERLWISYSTVGADGRETAPSIFVSHVAGAVPGLCLERVAADAGNAGAATTPAALAASLVRELPRWDPAAAPVGAAAAAIALYEAARTSPAVGPALRRAFSSLRPLGVARLPSYAPEADPRGMVTTSVSRLESFAVCPFQHFARYELGLTVPAEAALSPLVLGRLYHQVLDEFVQQLVAEGRALHELTPVEVVERLAAVRQQVLPRFAEALALAREDAVLADRLSRAELGRSLSAHRRWPRRLRPAATELRYGGPDGDWPALLIETPRRRRVALQGKIDRVDLAESGNVTLGVVFDYKSGVRRGLPLDAVWHGLELQLLAYLLVLQAHGGTLCGRTVRPVGALYVPLTAPPKSVAHPQEAEADHFDPFSKFGPRGVVDFDALGELTPADQQAEAAPGAFAARATQQGAIAHFDRSDALEAADFARLLELAQSRLGELADRWLDGEIEARPRLFDDRLPCKSCPYQSVCRFEIGHSPVQVLPRLSRSAVRDRLRGLCR